MHACFALVAALLASSPGASYSFSRPPRALGRSRDAAVAGVSMRASLEDRAMENAVSTAAVAAAAVSKAVSMKELEAPDLDRSFIALDSAASSEGLVDEAGLPLVYNKELIEAYWTKERGALQARWSEFLRYSVPFLTRVVTLLIRGGTDELMKNDKSLAREAREIMEQLGPTYVKLGQVLSVRPDILPQAALDELAILQDSVRPFETALAVEMIERELGGPLNNFFSEISEEPVAAASLAQVYKAKLAKPSQKKRLKNKTKSVKKIEVVAGDEMGTASEEEGGAAVVGETEAVEEGEEEEFEEEEERAEYVAVKVQRPAVLELVSKDLYVLRRAAEVYQGLIERFAPQQRTDYVALLNEWAVGFYTEFDFTNEARNQDLVKDLMQQQGVTDVYIPDTYTELTTRKVLVSEWVDGRKLSDCDPAEIRDLIKVGQETFLTQLLQVGVFHSDPHPGNLLRLDDDAAARVGARLCLLDFGLVARLGQGDMDAIVSAVIHCANRDYASLVDDFILLGILPNDCDRVKVIPLMDKALTPYVMGGGAKRYEAELKKMYGFDETANADMGAAVNNAVGGFQAMTQDLLTVLNDIPFSIPPYFALIGRAVVTLEGVALQGDPDYGIITEAYPFVARKLLREDRPEIQRALTEVLYARGGGGDGSSGNMFNSNRLAALVNSAMGVAARNSEGTFIDLDAVPDDAAGPEEVVKYLLSGDGAATSLWKLLEPELESGTDLLLRQSLRKTAATAFASLPQPPRFFGAPLGPAPQDIPAPLLLPRDLRSAISSISSADSSASSSSSSSTTSPVLASENDNNAAGAASAASAASTSAAVLSSVAGNARVVVTTAAELVETLAPPLTREEELLALQLTDVVSGLLGEDVAMVARGEVLTRPDAASRVVASVLDAVEPGTTTTTTAASTASESTASPLASSSAVRSALQLLRNFLPAGQPLSAATAATDGHGHDGMGAESMKLQEAQATLNSLTDEEKARGGEILRRTADRLVLKLEARLAALQ